MRTELWYPAWKLKTGMAGLCLESAIQWYYYIALRNCLVYCSLLDSHCSTWPQSLLILSLVFMLKDWLQKCVLQCKYILWMDLKNLTSKHTALLWALVGNRVRMCEACNDNGREVKRWALKYRCHQQDTSLPGPPTSRQWENGLLTN